MTTPTFDNLLAVDTSTRRLVLALGYGGDRLVQSDNTVEKSHGVIIMKKIDELFSSAAIAMSDINGLVVCVGPGSFTGLRIGLAAIKGLAVAMDLPVVGVSLFDLFAARMANASAPVHLAIQSRKGEWYLATSTSGGIDREDILIADAGRLRARVGTDTVYSIGFNLSDTFPDIRADESGGEFAYTGADLLYLGREALESGRRDDLTKLEPLYLQQAIAEKRFEERERRRRS